MKNKELLYKIGYMLTMGLFGVLGPVVKACNLPSPMISCIRAYVASIFLVLFAIIIRYKYDKAEIKKVLVPTMICGVLIATDWIGLFTAYNYTTVATATICYYISPILVIIGASIFLKEKMSIKGLICILVSFVGMVFVSGVFGSGQSLDLRGMAFAVFGAVSYTGIIIINRRYPGGDPIVRTIIQLVVAALVTTPYVCFTTDFTTVAFPLKTIILLLVLGIFLTAIPYIVYFVLILKIPSSSISIFAYMDPFVAVLVSIIFLGEELSIFCLIGGLLIIGSSIMNEINFDRIKETKEKIE